MAFHPIFIRLEHKMKKRSKMKKLYLLFTAFYFLQSISANDSTKSLSLNSFLQIVKQFHPVAIQAGLQVNKAIAGLTVARGNFDPLISSIGGNKIFDGTNYDQHNSTQLIIPTWYGIEVNACIEYLGGGRTDP